MATKVINSLTFGDTYVFTTPYATSSTGASTQAKVATLTPNSNFSLETGVRVAVKFSAENTASSPTLNVNSSGEKTIQFRGAALTSSLYRWAANSVVEFMYDGTYWQMLGAPNNTNSTYTVNNGTITLSAGTGLSGGGDFTTNQSAAETISFALAASGVTAGTYGPSANVTGSNGTTINVPQITVDTYGRVTGVTNRTYTSVNTDTNTHYTTKLFATSSTGTAHAATTNGDTYLRLFDDSTARQSIKITGSGATSVTSDENGVITISSTDTNTNTYGRNANTTSKIYLMGGTTQSASNKTTYSNVNCYASGGYLYSGGTKVSVEGHTHTFTDTNTAHSHTAGTGLTISGSGGTSGTTTYSANLNSTTSLGTIGTTSKLYAIGVDDNGKLCVNVPWTDNNTDTKVTQAADTTATTTLPVLLGYTSGTTATTQTVKKNSALLNFTPGATYGTLTVKGDIIAGGGSNSYGIHPATNNYSTIGKATKKWYKVYTSNIYVDSIYKTDGTTFSFPATMTWNTF